MSASPGFEPVADALDDDRVIAATRRWIERAVIGLDLCPFARAPFAQQRLRLRVSHARDIATLVDDLRDELEHLRSAPARECETSLLIHPRVLEDFLDYNDFLDTADALLLDLDLEGVIQIASFHPDYRFAGSAADAVENCSNRAPFPTLHLLRETSIDAALASAIDTEAIPERNIATLRALGQDGWQALWTRP